MSLTQGSALPEFSLLDQNGESFSSVELEDQAVVIFFYPKNFTPGCTAEVCGFRDSFQDFSDAGVRVIGISSDSQKSHQKFANRYNLPFTLLADTKGEVRRKFGVSGTMLGILPGRETFVFNQKGELIKSFRSLAADPHIKMALRQLKKL